jgi:nucleoside-diphosphate-sugar epimerase
LDIILVVEADGSEGIPWRGKSVLVTGGMSFIGSHLVERLLGEGACIRVADNLSSGNRANLGAVEGRFEFLEGDLLDRAFCRTAMSGMDTVFHLAADHGGRGYVDLHQAGPASNLALDGNVFFEAARAGVKKIVYASSGCVYPNHLQTDPSKEVYLSEDLVGPPYDADNMYGWAKLMGELALRAYCKERGMKGASCRFFTVYGPRGKEDHAVIAMIARALVGQDPFEVWGDGTQVRNWTHVEDIVEGTVLAGEKIDDGSAINLGTTERTTVADAARMVLEMAGHRAPLSFRKEMPTGPKNRVASNDLARRLLGWEPKVRFKDGLERTVRWYLATHRREDVAARLGHLLVERS